MCPYNSSHTFKQSKLVWHIFRCKDKLKVQHLFGTCKYNPLHIFRKDEIPRHERMCGDREKREQALKGLKEVIKQSDRSSSESKSKIIQAAISRRMKTADPGVGAGGASVERAEVRVEVKAEEGTGGEKVRGTEGI